MLNEYIETYKKLLCPSIENYLVPTLNTTREIPFWFIGYLTTSIDGDSVTENTKPITIEQAELYLKKDVEHILALVDRYSINRTQVSPLVKARCIVYILLEGIDKFKDSKFHTIISSPLYYQFMSYDFHIEFDKWFNTKIPKKSVLSKIMDFIKKL